MKTAIYISGQKVNNPRNIKGLEVELNFDKDSIEQSVSLTNLEFINEAAAIINNYIAGGVTGGNGIFEGLPIQLDIEKDGIIERVLDGYLDLTTANIDCDLVISTAVPKKEIDWINEVADAKTFEYIYKQEKLITQSDFVFIPYVINTIPNYSDILLAQVSNVVVISELSASVKNLSTNAIIAGTVIDSVGGIIAAVTEIIYVVALLVTLIELTLQTVELLIQPVKYKPAMYAKDLFRLGCKSFGLNFQSPILEQEPYSKMVVIPQSMSNPADLAKPRILGYLTPDSTEQNGYYQGTFGDFVRSMKTLFNGKIIIENDTLKFVTNNTYVGNPVFTLPPLDQHSFRTNADKIKAQFNFSFSYDINDKNTIEEWTGTNVQVTLQPQSIGNKDYFLLKNLENINSEFALAKRKESLTIIEEMIDSFLEVTGGILQGLATVVNVITTIVNAILNIVEKIAKLLALIGLDFAPNIPDIPTLVVPNLGNLIEDRLGMMKLENDMITVPKVALINKGVIDRKTSLTADNELLLNAATIYNSFYSKTSFAPGANHGQYKIYAVNRVPFTFADYQNVKNTSRLKTADNKVGEIISLKWNVYQQTASIEYKVNELFTKNLEKKLYEPTGR